MEAKLAGIELAIIINGLDDLEKIDFMKSFVEKLDTESKLLLENAMEVVI